ncbi:GDSL-type esterase/lipase family protein [Saccharothrix sp. Mg75]|uniref:GDSL-type esterase/lipase family protein n=1 Tax=Saccharothrix sp. Mg75 TaxID=3445357 RepID=UPI003EED0805
MAWCRACPPRGTNRCRTSRSTPPFRRGRQALHRPSDTNGCHHSGQVHPELLDPDHNLDFITVFRACPGDTTGDVRHGSNGERSQLDFPDTDTDLVIITIGGNDVEFADFARACVFDSCDTSTEQYRRLPEPVRNALPGRLDEFYRDITTRAPVPGSGCRATRNSSSTMRTSSRADTSATSSTTTPATTTAPAPWWARSTTSSATAPPP